MLNLDGTYSYSDVVSVQTDCENDVTGINLFPNPIGSDQANLRINFNSKAEKVVWIVVSDKLGRENLKFPISMIEGENVIGIDVSNLSAGIYFLSIKSENGKIITKQFVKIKE